MTDCGRQSVTGSAQGLQVRHRRGQKGTRSPEAVNSGWGVGEGALPWVVTTGGEQGCLLQVQWAATRPWEWTGS